MAKEITTKSGYKITKAWCRRCATDRPAMDFYEATDMGEIDTLMIMSVCKPCIQSLYDSYLERLGTMEKAVHKICTSLNVKYTNDAMSATRAHIDTMVKNGKNVKSVFGIYRMKLTATQKSMTKNEIVNNTYEDVAVVFTDQQFDIPDVAIPEEVYTFWGLTANEITTDDILYLNRKYLEFQKTHSTNTTTEIELLQQVCYTLLDIKHARANNDSTEKLLKTLQDLMRNLAISPNVKQNEKDTSEEAFGLWIRVIEEKEPAEFLLTDPRGDIYRDVSDVEKYYNDYFIRSLKNFVGISKDFTVVEDSDEEQSEFDINQDMFEDVEE